jgi:hypothetical protein
MARQKAAAVRGENEGDSVPTAKVVRRSAQPPKFHTIIIPETPDRDSSKGPEYVPVNMLGSVPEIEKCKECGGEGCDECGGTGWVEMQAECWSCRGAGSRVIDGVPRLCSVCGGNMVIGVTRPIEYHDMIQRGVEVQNVPDYALNIIANAVERHWYFKERPDKSGKDIVMQPKKSYPYTILESYVERKPEQKPVKVSHG